MSGLSDCLPLFRMRPVELKTRSAVAELAGTPKSDLANKASCGKRSECLFHQPNKVSLLDIESFVVK